MFTLKVKDPAVHEDVMQGGANAGDVIRFQWAWFVSGGVERPVKVGIGRNQPYAVGEYSLSPEGFGTTRYDKLELRFVRLVPLEDVRLRKAG